MADKASTKDLRAMSDDIEAVKRLADKAFGFHSYRVTPLEADGNDPGKYCLFEVCGITYRVNDGALSIVPAEEE